MKRRLILSLLASLSSFQVSGSNIDELFTWDDADMAFNRYCYECHGGFGTEADLDLINIDHKVDLEADPQKWVKIMEALRTHYMPHPEGMEMPIELRQNLITRIWDELQLQAIGYDPVSAPLRRLNRTEYSNTMNDLLMLDHDWKSSLPADNAGYGFDNIAAALTFSPLLMERYFELASEAAFMAIPQSMDPQEWAVNASDLIGGKSYDQFRVMAGSREVHTARYKMYFPGKGSYFLQLTLSAKQAGDENARASLHFDNKEVGECEVVADTKESPDTFSFEVQVDKPGEYEISVRFLNDYRNRENGALEDRNLIFHAMNLSGPHQNQDDLNSPFLERHFGGLPESLSAQALRDSIARFASRAYRRPATEAELNSLWLILQKNGDVMSREADIRYGLHSVTDAILTSPAFLFRFEGHEDESGESEYVLASWLSYFLWSSMPDDQLFYLAHRGLLRENLETEVARMLEDPKASALADNFAGQWWHLRDLEIHQPDRSIYRNANEALLADMREETKRFFQYVLQEDRPLLDFLNADYTFINERLARHYGIQGVEGEDFRKVSLSGTMRRGVWTQGGILTVTSYPNYTSPVLRGAWILENLIGLSPPPPPDNIPSLPGTEGNPNAIDLRASLAIHRENANCASCHDIMDPIGLTLEHFDAVGGLRSVAERRMLSEETLFDGSVISSPIDLAQYFEEKRSDDFVRNVARKLAIYAAGRGLYWEDEVALERLADYTRERDFRFSALIQGVIYEFAPIAEPVNLSTNTLPPRP